MVKKLRYFSAIERFYVFIYSLCSIIMNKIPKNLKRDYEFIRKNYNKIKISNSKSFLNIETNINNLSTKFNIKKKTSDSAVFEQIIIQKEYEIIVELFEINNIQPIWMIDAGANIGLTSIYISKYFPKIQVIALEPNKNTFHRAIENIKLNYLENIELLNMGLWHKNTMLKGDKSFRDGEDWSFRLIETSNPNEADLEATSIDVLMKSRKIETIDFLKIDIEGGEKDLFENSTNLDWLNNVKIIAIEIHKELNCYFLIINILRNYGFEIQESGELTIGVNKSF